VDIVLGEAKALDADLTTQDARAAAVIAHYRAAGQKALDNQLPLPVAPAEIKELQQERDTLIKSHASILRASLGTQAAARLDAYLSGEFATHLNLRGIAIPHERSTPPAK
jgi:anti-sigma factor RsiW